GIKVTLDVLGEFIKTLEEAEASKNEYLELIERAEKENIEGNYSIKPTSFGLLIDKEACYGFIREVVVKAAEYNNFIRIDMEDSPCTDLEIELFRKLKKEFPRNVGIVFQSYLKRTRDDIRGLLDLNSGETPLNIRLCKGIYVEPEEIAYKKYEEINENFLKDLEVIFQNKVYVGIATHDRPLIEGAYELIRKYDVPGNMYEFQMLYGVTPKLRQSIVDRGHTMRIYVPFGKDWFGYSTRRLKENPKMASHIIKALFYKG
ncbi:MAG: proline dehydrogenase family protein, partial [Bacteroidales bacterium]|nr:proline dehydrogenase family protein [Bacteroidales bacterium]